MQSIKFTQVPSVLRNAQLGQEAWISPNSTPVQEGDLVAFRVFETEGKRSYVESIQGVIKPATVGDILPGVLGHRKATLEFAGAVPETIAAGDILYLLGSAGVLGEITGIFPDWGQPMAVEILGTIVDRSDGNILNLKNFALPVLKMEQNLVPTIALVGTGMETGKTTMACKIIKHFTQAGKSVAAGKLTGLAFWEELKLFKEMGAKKVLDFTDMGFPSTCGNNVQAIIEAGFSIVSHLQAGHPDIIVLEFGDGLIGSYHVIDILKAFKKHQIINFHILAAGDLCGVYGAKQFLKACNIQIDLVTGIIANSQIGIQLLQDYCELSATSNRGDINLVNQLINQL